MKISKALLANPPSSTDGWVVEIGARCAPNRPQQRHSAPRNASKDIRLQGKWSARKPKDGRFQPVDVYL
jgi:hypothetical protein